MKTTSSIPPSAEGSSKIRKNRGGLPKLPAEGLPPKVIDLRGQRFGRLLVQHFAGLNSKQHALWECRCDCGNAHTTTGIRLRYGTVNSCGCLSRDLTVNRRRQDLAGRKFGRLTVKGYHHTARSYAYWACDCICGARVVVSSQGLLAGRARSCGCLRRELASKRSRHSIAGRKFGRLTALKYVRTSRNGHALWECRCECGGTCEVNGHDLQNGHIKSCGCFRRDLASSHKGSRHPSWNADLDQESRNKRRRGSPTQLQFSRVALAVRRRDFNTCVVCGCSGCMLHIHHLEPWAHAPALRYDTANLVTLCRDCHDQFHQLYGKDCDLDDFIDFMKE